MHFRVGMPRGRIKMSHSGVTLPFWHSVRHARKPAFGRPRSASFEKFDISVDASRLSITMEAAFCVEALEDAFARYGTPDICNTDKGSQFTGAAIHRRTDQKRDRHQHGWQGRLADNVFVERLWRTVKYEEVYLKAYDTASEARASIGRYLNFYNPASQHLSVYVVEENRFC